MMTNKNYTRIICIRVYAGWYAIETDDDKLLKMYTLPNFNIKLPRSKIRNLIQTPVAVYAPVV